jgi:hypothetical protein
VKFAKESSWQANHCRIWSRKAMEDQTMSQTSRLEVPAPALLPLRSMK